MSEQAFEDCISRNESTIAELQAVARQREAEVAALRGRVAAADAANAAAVDSARMEACVYCMAHGMRAAIARRTRRILSSNFQIRPRGST